MTKATRPTRPRTRGTSTEAEDHGNCMPPHVSPITTEVVDPVIRIFPLQKRRVEILCGAPKFAGPYMKSILLSFSLRVAGGVLRRMKSRTRVALNAHIGRLRSVLGSRHAAHPK